MADNRVGKSNRGFAAMDSEKQREIARKGGQAVSQDRRHMAAIGRKGGEARSVRDGNGQGNGSGEETRR